MKQQRITDLLKDNHFEEVMSIINVLYQKNAANVDMQYARLVAI